MKDYEEILSVHPGWKFLSPEQIIESAKECEEDSCLSKADLQIVINFHLK